MKVKKEHKTNAAQPNFTAKHCVVLGSRKTSVNKNDDDGAGTAAHIRFLMNRKP